MQAFRDLTADEIRDILVVGVLRFLAVVAVFGSVYWYVRVRKLKRETARRQAWLAERRARRGGEPASAKDEPPSA